MDKKNSKKSANSIIDIDDLKSVLVVASKNWYILVVFLIISFLVSNIYIYKLIDVYGAQTQLISNVNEQVNEQSIIGENYGSYYDNWNRTNIANTTQMRVIQSYDLIKLAVERMKLDVSYFIVGRIKTTEAYKTVPFEVNVLVINSKFYEQEIGLKVIDEHKYQLLFKIKGEEIAKEGFFVLYLIKVKLKIALFQQFFCGQNNAGKLVVCMKQRGFRSHHFIGCCNLAFI